MLSESYNEYLEKGEAYCSVLSTYHYDEVTPSSAVGCSLIAKAVEKFGDRVFVVEVIPFKLNVNVRVGEQHV